MIKQLHPDDASCIAEADLERLLTAPHVQGFLATLDAEVPGLDLTIDRAVAMGLLVVREFRAGRLCEHLRIGDRTFDDREWSDFCSAAVAFLEPITRPSTLLEPPAEPPTDPDEETRA